MPKRKRSDEGVAEIVSDPNCIAQGLIPDVGTETNQQRPEEEPSTSGNTVPPAAVQGGERCSLPTWQPKSCSRAIRFGPSLFKLGTPGCD